MNTVDDTIRERIAEARRRREWRRQQRAQLQEARQHGLEARHAAKMRRVYCGQCARPLRRGTYLRCVYECGTALCRKGQRCRNDHTRQCPALHDHQEAA